MGTYTTSAFQAFNAGNVSTIVPGPFALYSVSLNSLLPTQLNEGYAEVGAKTAAFDLIGSAAALQADLLQYIEPVVIGPGGALYLLDGHHTFTALTESTWGASNPTVFVNVVANYSGLTTSQFYTQMEASNFLLPLNNGTPEPVNVNTGAPIPTSLTALTNDPYRGLEYSILKNKSSALFVNGSNLTGAAGAATAGLDKMTGIYSDFTEAEAYQNADGGLGLPYLSIGDIALATQWNLNGNNTTTLPGYGTVHVYQLPGFILSQNIVNAGGIANATLANGTIDGNGTFAGITSVTFGSTVVGTVQSGLVLQLGADSGHTVTLNGSNSYTGGTTLLAGTLILGGGDASLGAASTGYTYNANALVASLEAANGIIFNGLTEGNPTLTIGTSAGGGTATFTTNRPIGVDGEAATLNPNGYVVTLTGQLVSVGTDGVGLGMAAGESDFTISDNSTAANGAVILAPTGGSNADFYGNLVISAGTLRVSSDAAMGNTTGNPLSIGQVELNGGTFQAGASFTSVRSLFLGGGSTYDTAGYNTVWQGSLADTQRTLKVINSSTTAAGAVTFGAFVAASTASLAIQGGTKGVTVTLTNGFTRSGNATVLIQPTSAASLGATDKLLATTAPTLTNGMVSPWIIEDNGGSASSNPYDFVTYGANGFVKATYSRTGTGASAGIAVAAAADVVEETTGTTTLTANAQAYALKVDSGATITATGHTLTLGNGSSPAGLILNNGVITGGALAFGGSEGIIDLKGSSVAISAAISGSNGLTLAGSGTLALGAVTNVTGVVNVDSGVLTLNVANAFASDAAGVDLLNVKSSPSNSVITTAFNQTFSTLDSVGNNSAINFSGGAILTIGSTATNLGSTIASAITETGAVTAGALTFNGTGLADLTGISSGKLSLVAGSTILVNAGRLRIEAKEFAAAVGIGVAAGAELQFAENQGDTWAGNITGAGDIRLIGGVLKLTDTANSYSGGTFVETGSTLVLTTANVSSGNANITGDGGTVEFDQTTSGTYAGVISDGAQMSQGTSTLSASVIKDDSSGANGGTVTFGQAQAYSGPTYVEAGAIDLAAANALATSSGVVLGRVGGGATAALVLGANQTLQSLASDASNTTSVQLGANTLTLTPSASAASSFGGSISGSGSLIADGSGTVALTGASSYAGGTTIGAGTLELGNSAAAGSGGIAFAANADATLKIDAGVTLTNAIAGFANGDTIDLAGLAYAGGTGALLSGNTLTVAEGSNSASLTLSGSYAGDVFHASADGNGGTDITLVTAPQLIVDAGNSYVNAAGAASVAFTVSGLAAGDTGTVTFTDGAGDQVAVAVSATQANYTADFATLTNGAISSVLTVAANAYSEAGNTVTLDASSPVVAIGSAGGLTNQPSQTISGSALENGAATYTAGTTVTISDNGSAVGTATVASDGSWSTTVTLAGDGAHSLTASDIDAAGNSGASGAVAYTLDTAAPAVAIASTGGLTDQPVQTVSGSALENGAATYTAGTTVTISDNGSAIGTATVAADGSWSTSVTLAGDGAHSLTASDTDTAGNSGASGAVSYTLDTATPAVAIAGTGGLTNQPVQTVSGSALENGATTYTAGTTVTISDNGTAIGSATVAADGSWSTSVTLAGDGAHSLTASDTDSAGNSGASSPVSYTLDTTPPAPPTGLADPGIANGYVDAANDTASQMLTGAAEADAVVAVYDNGAAIGTATADGSGAWSFTLGTLADGGHSLTAIATDTAGNTGTSSAALAFTVDTVAPAAPMGLRDAALVGGTVYASGDTANQVLAGTAEADATIQLYDNGAHIGTATATNSGAWSFRVGVLANGSHSIDATATDAAGNTGAASSALVFSVDTLAPPAPTGLADAKIVNGYINRAHDTPAQTLTGSAAAGTTVSIYDGSQLLGTATTSKQGSWAFKLGVLANGAHSLTATASQNGYTGPASAALDFTVKTTAIVPVFTDISYAAAGKTVTVSGTADADATIGIYNGATEVGSAMADANGDWTATIGASGAATLHYTAHSTDAAANTAVSATQVIFNPSSPAAISAANANALILGAAGDTLTVNGASDTLLFHAGFGIETVKNFAATGTNHDFVEFDKSVFADWAHLLGATKQVGSDLVITADATDMITLKNVALASFTASDAKFM